MFSPNSLDKNCVGSDNCSPGRNNATRFPVGMTSLGDENQQIRIQLAVHKYNSSPGNHLNNRTSVVSPVRHSFLKNSLKAKNFEGETERTSKSEKKNGNKYEGVGAFPTIHLRKSAVRYRPIRRFNDVKIPYPELPVSRFLSNLPEVNSDLKSNARSVLDVLEDLSGKKIQSNEENKTKLKGLGGDYLPSPNAVYKPLFIQKPKVGSVLTRDNTTQTLSPADMDVSSPQSNNTLAKNDSSDPKAELRRKLAKQNNEIFASLSSSISSSFAIKRKIDKVLPSRDYSQISEGSASKKSKTSDYEYKSQTDGSDSRLSKPKVKINDSIKLNRKSKINDANSPASPNKDRLTTIFLDMRNTSPKAQVFENSSTPTETKKPSENGLGTESGLSNGFVPPPVGNETKTPAGDVKNSSSTEKAGSPDDAKKEETERSKPMFNFPINKANSCQNDANKTSLPGFQFNGSSGSNFTIPTTTVSNGSLTNTSSSADSKANNVQDVNKPFVNVSKPDFSSFKFGAEEKVSEPSKPQTSAAVSVTTSASTTPQFNFGTTTLPSGVSFGISTTTQSSSVPAKPTFTFGKGASPSQQTKEEEKDKTPGLTTNTTTSQSVLPSGFTFGQKSAESTVVVSQPGVASSNPPSSGSNIITTVAAGGGGNSVTSTLNGKGLFSFGQKAETPAVTSQEKFGFSFGQNSDQIKSNLFSFGQKSTSQEVSQTTVVTTDVTSSNQVASTTTTTTTITTTQPALLFGQNAPQSSTSTLGQSSAPQATSLGAKSEGESLTTVTAPSTSQNSSDFSVKTPLFTSPSTTGFGSTTTQGSIVFGTATTSASGFKFGTSAATTQSQPSFGVTTPSQTVPVFGASSTSQAVPGFGNTPTTQTAGTFGGLTSNSTPAFGVSRQPTFTFGVSTTTQTTPSFGGTSTTETKPAFGISSTTQSTPSFGIPSTAGSTSAFGPSSTSLPTTGFGSTSTTQSTTAFGSSGFETSQAGTAFGAPASTQSGLQFGTSTVQNTSFGGGFSTTSTLSNNTFGASTATSSSGFGGSSTSFNQPFGSKPPATSLGQTSGIFGQNSVPSFSSNTAFNSNQNSVFGQKPATGGNIFDQNKIQTPGFGGMTQPFGTQNKFSFGMSTSNATGFTTSPPNTTAAPVFSFGANSSGSTFTFGSGGSGSSNTQTTPFAFKSPTNEPFKFGAATTKEGSGFGGPSTSTFTFSGQMNNNAIAEQKPAFNFGNTQVSSSSPFTFGTTPSPSVFSFGGSTSSASSGSGFNFGTPTPGGPFGQTPSASPGVPFAVPGTFSIGSGSSQSRPRATSRPRRRP